MLPRGGLAKLNFAAAPDPPGRALMQMVKILRLVPSPKAAVGRAEIVFEIASVCITPKFRLSRQT
jgi:hypothetical protein